MVAEVIDADLVWAFDLHWCALHSRVVDSLDRGRLLTRGTYEAQAGTGPATGTRTHYKPLQTISI